MNATPLAPERLDQIRKALATLSNPDAAYASPQTWASMLRDTLAELDRLMADLGADRPAYRVAVAGITCGHYTTRDEARRHALAAATAGYVGDTPPLKSPHWMAVDPDDEEACEALCHVDAYGDSTGTGYTVTPITVRAAYDPNADW